MRMRRAARPSIEALEGKILMSTGLADPASTVHAQAARPFAFNGTLTLAFLGRYNPVLNEYGAVGIPASRPYHEGRPFPPMGAGVIVTGLLVHPKLPPANVVPDLSDTTFKLSNPKGSLQVTFSPSTTDTYHFTVSGGTGRFVRADGTTGTALFTGTSGYALRFRPNTSTWSSASPNAPALSPRTNSVVAPLTAPTDQSLSTSKPGGGGAQPPVNTDLGPAGTITTSNNGNQTSAANAITIDGSGDIVVAGSGTVSGTRGFQVDRYKSTGALDTTFGTGGGVNTAVGFYKGLSDSRATAVTILPNGDILAAGDAEVGSGQRDFALVFYTPSGTLDTTAGGGTGKVITSVGTGNADLSGLTLQTVNGTTKILVTGTLYRNSSRYLSLARYNLNGTLDTSFGSGGTLTWSPPGANMYGNALTVDSSGRIVVAGSEIDNSTGLYSIFLGRWNANGTGFDTTFGNGSGYVVQNPNGYNRLGFAVAIQPDGKIVVGGAGQGPGTGTVVLRDNSDGSLDTSFGTDGWTNLVGGPEADGVEILSSGDILVTYGAYDANGNEMFGLAWLTASGAPDTNFGGGTGIVTTSLPASVFPLGVNPLAIQPADGKILEVGTYGITPTQFAMVRYNSDGSLDTSF